jgi:hypothetical protein
MKSIKFFQFPEVNTMSENVDGFVGDKSIDFIMDFLGEKKEATKKDKKKSKASKKKKQQKKGEDTAKKEKKEQPKQAAEAIRAAKKAIIIISEDEEEFEEQSAEPAALDSKILSDASVPNLKAAAVTSTKESGEKPKSEKSWFAQVEETEGLDAGTSDLGASKPQKKTEAATTSSSVASSNPEPEAPDTSRPPRERTYHTRVFVNSKLQAGNRGYQR